MFRIFFFIFCSLCTLLSAQSAEMIDKQIAELQEQLNKSELQEMKKNVQGENYFIADWDKYGEQLKKIKQLEEEEDQIRKQIKDLEAKKAQLAK